ncbi:transcription termination factor 4, mitochondrial isoform X2 [Phascolarctos cinereus]|uniref:Transcription termination factor 4, mitochondrial n=1 Tax=Phascolarctos cinereus TaxID=38626 RepID=A0A6P5KGE5_PHACI|nr:transcription termination factor 4, mitochondrial isoform X2 [Phascolarctos cinereus]
MAARCRQVFQWHRLVPFPGLYGAPWLCVRSVQDAAAGAPSQMLGRRLTTASSKGDSEERASLTSRNRIKELESSKNVVTLLVEKEPSSMDQGAVDLEKVVILLLDMGFSETHIKELFRIHAGIRPEQLLAVVSELMLLGLDPDPVCKALQKNPRILRLTVKQLKSRASHLRRLGLGGGNLQHMTHCCPDLFTMTQQRINALVSVLKDRCLFTGQQVTEILYSCPRVLQEDPAALEYKFQYAYFRMGIKQRDLVKTKYFRYSMTKIKQRHVFLERLGLYQTPDKKGQTQICNPSVNSVLRVPEAEFLAKVAHSSWEEFEVFKQLLAREELEEGDSLSVSEMRTQTWRTLTVLAMTRTERQKRVEDAEGEFAASVIGGFSSY